MLFRSIVLKSEPRAIALDRTVFYPQGGGQSGDRGMLLLGGSSGINIAGAIHVARELGPGHTIVTLLCDSGVRYASKLFNPDFLRSKHLPVPDWLEAKGSAPQVFAP